MLKPTLILIIIALARARLSISDAPENVISEFEGPEYIDGI